MSAVIDTKNYFSSSFETLKDYFPFLHYSSVIVTLVILVAIPSSSFSFFFS